MTDQAAATKRSIADIFDRASDTYDRTGVEFFGVVGRTLVDLADPAPGARVLELGCGRGAATFPAAERVGGDGEVLATDLAEGMVRRLQADVDAAGLRQVTCQVCDAESPEVEPEAWDVVLASLVLFFLPNHRTAIPAYRDLLRPGGRLAFSWFVEEDERWDPIYESLVAELPAGERGPRRPGPGGPFAGVAAMDAFLTESGFGHVRTEVRTLAVRFPDVEAWWATLWSHGRRATMEKLRDHGVLESTMARMDAEFDGVRRVDGSLEWTPAIGYTLASR